MGRMKDAMLDYIESNTVTRRQMRAQPLYQNLGCKRCDGAGAIETASGERRCVACDGTGESLDNALHNNTASRDALDCKTCDGTGVFNATYPTRGGGTGTQRVTCPHCHGCGKR